MEITIGKVGDLVLNGEGISREHGVIYKKDENSAIYFVYPVNDSDFISINS